MIRANPVEARRAREWLATGWTLFRRAPLLWLSVSFVYLVVAMLLEQIPFIGWLILVLLSPMFLFSTLPIAKALADNNLPADALPARPTWYDLRGWARFARELILRAARRLFSGFTREDELMPVMVISTLLLGGVVVLRILAELLKANPFTLPTVLASGVGPSVWITALVGLVLVLVLTGLLFMTFLFTVPLLLFRREYPLPAIESSFSVTINNLGAFGVFLGVFVVTAVVARLLFFTLSFPYDYLAFLAIGLVALPVLVCSLYASYLDLFPARR